jgi:thymidylate kinase
MKLIKVFLENLEKSNIRYVHWKSNTNIKLALSGIDDLDILVDPNNERELNDVFKKLKFVRAYSEKDSWQDGITHFIGLDIDSKKLVHVHLHYKLALGYDYDKCFKLPIVDLYLENITKYEGKVYLPSYENEYCILVIRLILKNALTPFLLRPPHKQYSLFKQAKENGVIKDGGYTEFLDLKDKIDKVKLNRTLETTFSFLSKELFEFCISVLENNNNVFAYFKAGSKLKKELVNFRDYGEIISFSKAFLRLNSIRFYSLLRKLYIYNKITGKKTEHGGRIIAFVGGDGAGKTTTISNLRKNLKSQFSLKSIHVGKPSMSLKGLIFLVVSKLFSLIGFKSFSKALFYISIAINRQNEFKKACKLRDKGIIVLQDRMPLKAVTAMDCPRVDTILNGKYNKLSKYEKKQYKSIKGVDMLFVMKLNPEIALQRRPNDDPDELRIRSGQIWNNDWVAPFAHEINTGENNPEQVQNILLKKVWENFNTPFIRSEIIGLNGTGKTTLLKKIKKKYPNTCSNIPVKEYKILMAKAILSSFIFGIIVLLKTKNKNIAILSLHFKASLLILNKWKKKKSLPSKNFIYDQGPYFQAAILYKEKCISKNVYIDYINQIQDVIPNVFMLTASNEVLYNRVKDRVFSNGRGQFLKFDEFTQFCQEYLNSFNILSKSGLSLVKINTENTNPNEIENIFHNAVYEK